MKPATSPCAESFPPSDAMAFGELLSPPLHWSDALSVSMPVMDQTHMEFVDLLAQVHSATDEQLVVHWQALIDHTEAHFGQEDRWMLATGFAPGSCHMSQHRVVLQVLREGLQAGQCGQLGLIRCLARELATWFPHHAQNMDAGLALHLKSVGHEAVGRQIGQP